MGSSTSKSIDPEPSLGRRSYSRNVFQASCIQPTSGSSDDEQDQGFGEISIEICF
ncbi:hypothetical protein Hanom_Chr03g00258661 [Helianthus anomalus]